VCSYARRSSNYRSIRASFKRSLSARERAELSFVWLRWGRQVCACVYVCVLVCASSAGEGKREQSEGGAAMASDTRATQAMLSGATDGPSLGPFLLLPRCAPFPPRARSKHAAFRPERVSERNTASSVISEREIQTHAGLHTHIRRIKRHCTRRSFAIYPLVCSIVISADIPGKTG